MLYLHLLRNHIHIPRQTGLHRIQPQNQLGGFALRVEHGVGVWGSSGGTCLRGICGQDILRILLGRQFKNILEDLVVIFEHHIAVALWRPLFDLGFQLLEEVFFEAVDDEDERGGFLVIILDYPGAPELPRPSREIGFPGTLYVENVAPRFHGKLTPALFVIFRFYEFEGTIAEFSSKRCLFAQYDLHSFKIYCQIDQLQIWHRPPLLLLPDPLVHQQAIQVGERLPDRAVLGGDVVGPAGLIQMLQTAFWMPQVPLLIFAIPFNFLIKNGICNRFLDFQELLEDFISDLAGLLEHVFWEAHFLDFLVVVLLHRHLLLPTIPSL